MKGFKGFQNFTQKAVTYLIVVLFLLMFGITNLNVFMRYFLNKPISFSVEMGRYCFVSIIFLGAIITTREDRHIQVDFLLGMMSPKLRFIAEQSGRVLMTLFFGLLSYETFRMTIANVAVRSSAMQIPMAVPYGIMFVGSVGICLESLINVVEYQLGIKIKKRGEEEAEELL